MLKVEFDAEPIAFMRSQLAGGNFTFFQFLSRLELESGTVHGYFDTELTPSRDFQNRLYPGDEFSDGGKSWRSIYKAIAAFIAKNRSALAIAPFVPRDVLPQPRTPVAYLEYNGPVPDLQLPERSLQYYLYLKSRSCSVRDVTKLLYVEPYFHRRCVLTRAEAVDSSTIMVSEGFLGELAANAEHILFAAYSGDAMLVWSKTRALQAGFDLDAGVDVGSSGGAPGTSNTT